MPRLHAIPHGSAQTQALTWAGLVVLAALAVVLLMVVVVVVAVVAVVLLLILLALIHVLLRALQIAFKT
jgi:hypothetical protein